MKYFLAIVHVFITSNLIAQVNFHNQVAQHMLQVEGCIGYPESMITIGIPLNSINFFQFSSTGALFNTWQGGNQFLSIENRIHLKRNSSLNLGMGYLFDIQSGANFDIAGKLGYYKYFSKESYIGLSLFGSIPREIKSNYALSGQITLGYLIPKQSVKRGIVNYRLNQSTHSGFALFNSNYSLINYSFTTKKLYPFLFDSRVATDLGNLFLRSRNTDWQSWNLGYSIILNDYVEIKPFFGLLTQIHNINPQVGGIFWIDTEVHIINDIYFKISLAQANKPLIRQQIQPWAFAGFGISI